MSRESRYLALVLRHQPETIGLKLDRHGWVGIAELLRAMKRAGRPLSRAQLLEIVEQNDKRRFTISPDGQRIRAAQGHSVDVDLGLTQLEPPPTLYHGTASHSLDAIFASGLLPGRRRHVHLSGGADTALDVGRRHGKPVILCVAAREMHEAGHVFFKADNGVWLTDHVPARFIGFGVVP
ncbi:RNA 2'-phosphotransferase [Tropicibacter alexandrii]|uniref:RNA 2'-phosphotransferase n=1 Tax=Tropicibacter alexandrii TaxID=2267683 RepID=UPI000EF44DD4|nr:RNA 2'-phosphotransferase [Tropicibacter alexandrii]